ncbi:MAG: ABC transporter permease [Hyphomicrobiaceae bacterium]|nr:ABC transporter permease [Hyphomicrobiaceae bacterium]
MPDPTTDASVPAVAAQPAPHPRAIDWVGRALAASEAIVIPVGAVVVSAALFSLFLLALGKSPQTFFELLWRGGFGTAFSWQNTLVRTAPLIFTALCVAIPARLGLVIIGGEGALVIGGFAAAVVALPFIGQGGAFFVMPLMFIAATLAGALWIGFVGALRHHRGVNETIASLLMFYIAVAILNFFVEGALRSPADPNKPSTTPIGADLMVGQIPGLEVHWGLAFGVVMAIGAHILMSRTTFGFAARVTGGNVRAARAQGLPVGRLMLAACALAGACAGIAGYFEVAAILGKANASLVAGYGFTGILVSFLARHNPLAIPPVAILFGGLAAAGGLIQRRMGLPDATVQVLQGLIFLIILLSETVYGRIPLFSREARA